MLLRAKDVLAEAGLCFQVAGRPGLDCRITDLICEVSAVLASEGLLGDEQRTTEWTFWRYPEVHDAGGPR